MSHVDEGALHAYLDGALEEYPQAEAERIRAHLDACADCAERLEAEHRIRSDAHAMLDLAAPAVEAPSFEELRAYVERTRPRSRISRMQRLGWAASVVLALGAGWMIREGQFQTRAPDVRQERFLAPAGDVAPPDAAPAGGRVATEEAGAAQSNEQTGGTQTEMAPMEAASTGAEGSRSTVAVDETPAESPEASDPAPAIVFEEPDLQEMSVRAPRAAVEADEAARVGSPADVPELESVSLDDATVRGDSAVGPTTAGATPALGDTAGNRVEEVNIEPTTFQAVERGATVTAAEPSAEDRRRTSDTPSASVSALRTGVAEPSFPPATPVEAPASEDSMAVEPLLAIPGYEVISVTNLGDGTTAWGVRVVQALGDGRRMEVVNLEPEIDPNILPEPSEGWNEVRMRVGPRWIVLRGPLAEAELSSLLQRILPESR